MIGFDLGKLREDKIAELAKVYTDGKCFLVKLHTGEQSAYLTADNRNDANFYETNQRPWVLTMTDGVKHTVIVPAGTCDVIHDRIQANWQAQDSHARAIAALPDEEDAMPAVDQITDYDYSTGLDFTPIEFDFTSWIQ